MVPGTSELKVLDQSTDGWIQVETTDGNGYVSTDFVSLSTSYKFAESKAAEQARLAQEAAEKAAEEAAAKAAREAASKAKNKKSNSKSNSKSTGSEKSYSAPASSGNGSAVVNYASQFVGNPYVYGGSSLTNGTDCSGYVMSVYKAFGVSLPHSSSAMRGVGTGVSVSDMQPGDIVCYSGHVGIYAGNGQLLNASTPSTGIKYSSVNYKPILSVRRVY
jgi:cell wall-associated NlpC family hydrolase